MNITSKEILGSKFIRFVGVGAINTGFGYFLYASFIFIGFAPEIALLVASIVGVAFNFFTSGRLVFRSKDNKRIGRFLILYGFFYVINSLPLRSLVILRVDPYIAQVILLPAMAISTYFGQKKFVFNVAKGKA